MKKHNPDTLLVLVLPPNVDELKNMRNDRSVKCVEDDIKNLKDAKSYDHVLIKNAYRVLLTRGSKGCFVFCEDQSYQEYLKKVVKNIKFNR